MQLYTFKSLFSRRMKYEKEHSKDLLMSRLPGYTTLIVQTSGHHQVSNRLYLKNHCYQKVNELLSFFSVCF